MKITFPELVERELSVARALYPKFDNPHHAYAVMLEELESYRLEVFKPRHMRDQFNMFQQLVQVSAMAQRAAEDLMSLLLEDEVTSEAFDRLHQLPPGNPAGKDGGA